MTDELVGRESSKGLETLGEVVSHQERVEMFLQLLMGLVVVPFDGRILEGLVHALDLSIGPGMFRPGAAMFDGVLFAGISKRMNPEEEWRHLFGSSSAQAGSGVLSTKCVPLSVSTVWIV